MSQFPTKISAISYGQGLQFPCHMPLTNVNLTYDAGRRVASKRDHEQRHQNGKRSFLGCFPAAASTRLVKRAVPTVSRSRVSFCLRLPTPWEARS